MTDLIGGSDTRVLRRYETFPAVALEVSDPAALERLASLDADPRWTVTPDHEMELASFEESVGSIKAPELWEAGFTGKGATVAVVDTAVDRDAIWLSDGEGEPRVTTEACFSAVCPDGENEMHGPGAAAPGGEGTWWSHGTQVAGIAAGNGADGYVGVAPEAEIVGVRLGAPADCPDPEPCGSFAYSDAIAAFDWLAANHESLGLDAVNLSAGWDAFGEPCYESPFRSAIGNLVHSGVAVVVSTGNDYYKDRIKEPACVPEAVAVGATSGWELGQLAVSTYSNSAPFIDFVAPTGAGTGTSAAAPYVSGALALLGSAVPDATVPELVSALTTTGIPVIDASNRVSAPYPQLASAHALLARPGGLCAPQAGNSTDCPKPRPAPPSSPVVCGTEPIAIQAQPGIPTLGTPCADVITGSDGDDVIHGGGGDDVIFGNGGRDTIDAGSGADTVYGGSGVDTIDGGSGNDVIFGQHNPDFLDGGVGLDQVSGGTGDDQISGGPDGDALMGDDGDDVLDGQSGPDNVWGGIGDDTLLGGASDDGDRLLGGPGDDFVAGGPGNDQLAGNLGKDTVYGGEGPDTVDLVNDVHGEPIAVYVSKDFDEAFGGSGHDELWFHVADAVHGFESFHAFL